uniref:Wsv293a-like protein n=1 Tax=Penaeus monodon majanivirus B TaxID=2984272 RepID=A0A9C7F6E5_9VIRU|nr:MAG: wsv293a-like protein [Penaeus monodon majanivirus B]
MSISMDTSSAKETWGNLQEERNQSDSTTILTDFNDRVHFFMGPMYRDIAYMIEEDKSSIVTDKIFVIFIISLTIFCSGAVLYRLVLYYNLLKRISISYDLTHNI